MKRENIVKQGVSTESDWHAIIAACMNKSILCSFRQFLIEQGAQVNAKTIDDRTALMDAAATGHLGIVQVSKLIIE